MIKYLNETCFQMNNATINFVGKANDTVGIDFINDKIKIFVPQVFRLEDNESVLKKDLIQFLKSISIAKTINSREINKSKGESNKLPVDSYLWIIRDFLENGYFYNREKIFSKDRKGKIDWKRTLRTTPIVSNGNIIYNEIVTSKMSASNDIIAQIYRICLKQSQNRIGWLFDYNFNVEVQQIKSIKEMIYLVNQELMSTFDDVKRIRFKHMLSILKSVDTDNALLNEFSYTIDNYYYVFEQMIDKFFKGIKDKKDYNPAGYWKLNGKSKAVSSELRPDTIYKRKDETFIIDAKMYQYGYSHDTKDLPTTSSMQKQITYGDYVKNNVDPNTKVRNAFILPYNKNLPDFKQDKDILRFNDDNLVYIGEAYVEWRESKQKSDHDRIFAYLIDFNFLLKHYNEDGTQYIETLCDSINELLKQ